MKPARASGAPLRGPAGRIDPVCDRFESDWLAGRRPRLEDFLGEVGAADRAALLRELLGLELEYRSRLGEKPAVEEYRRRLPDHAALVDELFTTQATAVGTGSVGPCFLPTTAPPPFPAPTDGGPSPQLPGYELLGEIARGGMGVVYKALQQKLNRTVALKMLLTGAGAGPEDRQRFRVEAEAVARLQHPNIVQIYEIGEHEGRLFFSMEFCPGGSLDRKLRGAPLPPPEAARLTATLARAVHAAHLQNVVHRDLKPGNVLLAADGTPKVSDFGLSKRLDADDGLSRAGQVLGTPSYMAPEQAGGPPPCPPPPRGEGGGRVGPAADVYALGAILYELLTGRPPFRGPTVHDTMRQVVADEPAPPRRLQPRTPRDLETICLKCLAKAPAKRYATANALAEDLERFLAGRPILARPVGVAERVVKWARRRPSAAALAGTALLLVLSVLGWAVYAWRVAEAGRETETKRASTEADLRRQVEQQLYFHRIAEADHEWEAGKPAWASEQLDLCPEPLRRWEWGCLRRRIDGKAVRVLGEHPWGVSCVAAGPDGSCVASAGGDGFVRLWDPETGALLRELPGRGKPVDWAAFGPDGATLASAGQDGLVTVWDWRSGTKRMEWQAADGRPLACLAFDPRGRELATSAFSKDGANEVRIWDADAGSRGGATPPLLRTLTGHTDEVTGLAYSPDGALLATASHDGKVFLWDAATGEKRLEFSGHHSPVAAVAFHPDGQTLLSAAGELQAGQEAKAGEVLLWSARTGQVEHPLHEHTARSVAVAFSPDGRLAATGSWDGSVVIWDARGGLRLFTLPGHPRGVTSVAFAAGGRYLITGGVDGTVRVWDGGP